MLTIKFWSFYIIGKQFVNNFFKGLNIWYKVWGMGGTLSKLQFNQHSISG